MPKRTYPDQAGLQERGLGAGFVNMRQLYTNLEEWEALFQTRPVLSISKTLLEYWYIPYLGVIFQLFEDYMRIFLRVKLFCTKMQEE